MKKTQKKTQKKTSHQPRHIDPLLAHQRFEIDGKVWRSATSIAVEKKASDVWVRKVVARLKVKPTDMRTVGGRLVVYSEAVVAAVLATPKGKAGRRSKAAPADRAGSESSAILGVLARSLHKVEDLSKVVERIDTRLLGLAKALDRLVEATAAKTGEHGPSNGMGNGASSPAQPSLFPSDSGADL